MKSIKTVMWVGISSLMLVIDKGITQSAGDTYAWCSAAAAGWKFPPGWKQNRRSVLEDLANKSSKASFAVSMKGQNPNNTLYGMLQCYGISTQKECHRCALSATSDMNASDCLESYYERGDCFVHYATHNFTGKLDTNFTIVDYGRTPDQSVSQTQILKGTDAAEALLTNLSSLVKGGYAAAGLSTEYADLNISGMVQCWEDISVAECKICLRASIYELFHKGLYAPWPRGVSLLNSCVVKFFFLSSPSSASALNAANWIPLVLFVLGFQLLFAF